MILPKSILRWYDEMPSEAQMRPKDKYTVFDRKARGYRKGVHSKSRHAVALAVTRWLGME